MNNYEKRLLSHLQEDNSQSKNDPLADVKNAMGEIAFSAGNPLTKTEITLQITLTYWDTATGLQVLPGALPVNLQTKLPVFLFGLTDFYGGFAKNKLISGINTLIGNPNWTMFNSFTTALGTQQMAGIIGNSSTDAVIRQFVPAGMTYDSGDLVLLFYGGAAAILAVLKVHCNNVSYGTFLNSFVSDLITINSMRLIVPIANINQFLNPLIFGYQTLFGKTFSDNVDPRQYITSTDFQQQICDIPIQLPIDKAALLQFDIIYTCQSMSIVLFVEKVEPLTHKSNLNKQK